MVDLPDPPDEDEPVPDPPVENKIPFLAAPSPDGSFWGEKDPAYEYTALMRNKGITEQRYRKSQVRRDRFLRAFSESGDLTVTLRTLGIPIGTYEAWRRRYPDFKIEVDRIKMRWVREWKEGDPTKNKTFVEFRKQFFGMDTYWHQHRIIEAIESAKPMEITMVLVPPEHGKTTVIEDYICFSIANNPDIRIAVVSQGEKHAKKIIQRVTRRLTDPELSPGFIARYGPFYQEGQERMGKPWTAAFVKVARAMVDERDYTLEARGSTSSIAGTRCDLLIVDDMQSRANYNQTDRLVEDFRQDFLTRPGTTGRTIIVGTRVGNDDFYERLLQVGEGGGELLIDHLVALPALDRDGRALCPEMWNEEQLAKKRAQVGEAAWWRNYQQQPQKAGRATFAEEDLEAAKNQARSIGSLGPGIPVVVGVDPSMVGTNALVATALQPATLSLLDCVADDDLGRTEEILVRIEQLARRYSPTYVVVEINAFQKGLAHDDRLIAMSRQYGFRLREHTTGRNKLDPQLGVGAMASSFIAHEVDIPWANDLAVTRMEPLVKELSQWRPDIATRSLKQDRVMALWFCWLVWRELKDSLRGSSTQISGRRGLPWAPTQFPFYRRRAV